MKDITSNEKVAVSLASDYFKAEHGSETFDSEEMYKTLFELAPNPMVTVNIGGVITACNVATTRRSGFSKDEIVGKHFSKLGFLRASDIPKYVKMFSSALRGKMFEPFEAVWKAKDGSYHVDEIHLSLIKKGDKKVGFLVISRDITERKKAEGALLESEQKFKRLFMSSPEAAVFADADSRVLDANSRFIELFGYSLKEVKGKRLEDLVVPEDKQDEAAKFTEKVKKGYAYHDTVRKRKNGTLIPVSISAAPIVVEGKFMGGFVIYKDLSERKQMEEALGKSEQKFRNIFENANDAMTFLDSSGRILEVNEKAVEVFGGKKEELLGKHFTRVGVLSPKDIPNVLSAFRKILTGKKATLVVCMKNKQGQEKVLECSGSITRMDDKFAGVLVVVRDITKRREAEEALRKSEEKYRSLVELAPDGIITVDMKGVVTSINTSFSEITGYSKNEIVGKHLTRLPTIQIKDIPKYLKLFRLFLKGKEIGSLESVYCRKNGNFAWVEAHPGLIREGGKIVGVQVVLRDITERKRAEEALRESRERLRNVFAASPDAITVSDLNGNIIECNQATLDMLGFSSKDELIGKNTYTLIAKKDHQKAKENLKKTLEQGSVRNVEFTFLTKNGQEFQAEVSSSVLKDSSGRFAGFVSVTKNISERKKTEEEIKKFKTISDNAGYGSAISDLKGNLLYVNESFAKMHLYRAHELIGKNLSIFHTEEQMNNVERLKQQLREKSNYIAEEVWHKRKDNSVFPTLMNGTLIKDEKGKPLFMATTAIDITERKNMEEVLRAERDLLEIVTRNIGAGLAIISKDYRTFWANEVLKKVFGDVEGKICYSTYNQKNEICPRCGVREIFETGKDKVVHEQVGKDVEGKTVWSEITATPIRDKDGNITSVLELVVPITERKRMEEKLKQYSEHLEELARKRTEELLESEKRYSVLVEEASDGVLMIQDGKTVLVNRRLSEIVGYPVDELIGLTLTQTLEKFVDKKYHKIIKEMYERRMQGKMVPPQHEVEFITKTGESVPIERGGTRVNFQGRPAVLYILRDLRERKRLEEQRLKLEKLATIGELATMVAHDLRNPLTSIRNAGFYIRNTCPGHANTECKTALEMLDLIERETLFANNVINDLLDFAAKRPLQKQTQDINKIIENSLIKSNIPEKIKIRKNFDKKAIANVDEKQLERIFLNLTKNAVQAMPNTGELTITTNETKDHVEIRFTDTGVGISEGNMNKIFQPLFTTKAKGIGMGLAICRKIVEQHDGTIDVETKAGRGTIFTIRLPKKQKASNQ